MPATKPRKGGKKAAEPIEPVDEDEDENGDGEDDDGEYAPASPRTLPHRMR